MCGVPTAVGREAEATEGGDGREIRSDPKIALVVAGVGVALVALLIFFLQRDPAPEVTPPVAQAPAGAPAPAASGGGPAGVDLSSMTPREAADRLFNRVMESVSAGDTAQARAFAPMAISAYGMVDQLDTDGQYHLAVIQLVNNQSEDALATAEGILAQNPVHLFGLFTAAQANQALGNEAEAREQYRAFLDNYDAELAAGRLEYTEHAPVLPSMQTEARQRVG